MVMFLILCKVKTELRTKISIAFYTWPDNNVNTGIRNRSQTLKPAPSFNKSMADLIVIPIPHPHLLVIPFHLLFIKKFFLEGWWKQSLFIFKVQVELVTTRVINIC